MGITSYISDIGSLYYHHLGLPNYGVLSLYNDGTRGTPEFQFLGIGSPTLRVAMAGSTAVPAVPVTGVALELGLSQETNQQWNTSGTRWYK
jgi:hypothetical protein